MIGLPPLWLSTSLVIGWLGVVFGLAEVVARRLPWDRELARKIVHIGSGNVILLAWWGQIPLTVGLGAAVLCSGLTLASYFWPLLPTINGVGRQSLGTFFYALSIGLLLAWFWPQAHPEYAAVGILVMAWGDGLAAVVGQTWGSHAYEVWGMRKTWEGTLAMVLVSGVVTGLVLGVVEGHFSWQLGLISAIAAVGAALLESVSRFGLDNLTVPLGSAALVFWCSQLMARL